VRINSFIAASLKGH